jgi:DNA-binding transcriptional regulator/RsmH inhibitor MraZ
MNQEAFDKFMKLARQYKLVGDGATLEAWDSYAWQVRA